MRSGALARTLGGRGAERAKRKIEKVWEILSPTTNPKTWQGFFLYGFMEWMLSITTYLFNWDKFNVDMR